MVALAVALADVRERVRRPSFLAILALAALLGYAIVTEVFVLRLGAYRGVYDAAWIGVLVAVALGVFMSLVGFYLVRGGVQRDAATGVGQVLAATPLRSISYLTGTFLGGLVVLLAVVAALAVAAVVMVLVHGEGARLDLGAVLVPFVVLTVPVAALTAAAAVLFDCVPILRQGLGNVAYFVLWLVLMATFGSELIGFGVVEAGAATALAAAGLPYGGGIALGTGGLELTPFLWPGLAWAGVGVGRLPYLALAAALVLIASVPFERFDTARGRAWLPRWPSVVIRRSGASRASRPAERTDDAPAVAVAAPPSAPRPLPPATRGSAVEGFLALVRAELALLLRGRPWVWYLVAVGLVVAGALAPAETVRRVVLPLAWIWPLLVWSELGAREATHRMRDLIAATPAPVVRPLLASWLAGVALALAAGAGALVHAVQHPDMLLGFVAGATFLPALALALGSLSGSPRPFQVVALLLWYLGALNGIAAFDVTAATPGASAARTPLAYLALAAALLCVALASRWAALGPRRRS